MRTMHYIFTIISVLLTVPSASFAKDDFSIFEAVLANDYGLVEQLIESDPSLIEVSGFGMGTPLHAAVSASNIDMVSLLIAAGTDVNAVGNHLKFTPLEIAARSSNLEIAQQLIDAGANVNWQNESGQSALMHSISKKNIKLSALLIKVGANLSSVDSFGRNAMAYAIESGSLNVVELLSENNAETPDPVVIANSGRCIGCHVPEEYSDQRVFRPIINGLSSDYIEKQLTDIANGTRNSDFPNRYRENRLNRHIIGQRFSGEIANYLSSLAVTRYTTAVENTDEGQKLFNDKKYGSDSASCASCHGNNAMGNKAKEAPRLAGQEASYLAQELKEYRAGIRANDAEAQMRNVASGLNDHEIDTLSNYLSALR